MRTGELVLFALVLIVGILVAAILVGLWWPFGSWL